MQWLALRNAHSSGIIRRQLRSRGITAVIPEKSDTIAARGRRGSRGGRPPQLDVDLYKGRNVVERSFALAKHWRGLATRYDKLAITYRAAVTLCAILTWLRQLGDTPETAGVPAEPAGHGVLSPDQLDDRSDFLE